MKNSTKETVMNTATESNTIIGVTKDSNTERIIKAIKKASAIELALIRAYAEAITE